MERHVFMEHRNAVTCLEFHPSGDTLVSGSEDKSLILTSLRSGSLIRKLDGHDSALSGVAFSSDGLSILSGSGRSSDDSDTDNSLRIWDYATLQVVSDFTGHNAAVHAVSVSINGEYVASSSGELEDPSGDNSIIIWKVVGGREVKR